MINSVSLHYQLTIKQNKMEELELNRELMKKWNEERAIKEEIAINKFWELRKLLNSK